ncbi:MAG TPA: hypothetical protein VHB25_02115 [Gemmatimonadaceae bacterium]|nr:hypothetical protein [Gemmatimonadaceae bacterium]
MTRPTSSVTTATWYRALAALLTIAAAAAVWSTARVFSGTVDEPAHIAAGMQWLTTHRYDYDLQHPPIGRVAAALGPYLHGTRGIGAPGVYEEGAAILGRGAHYADTLASARHGELLFLIILALATWAWGTRLAGEVGGLAATLLVVANPNILAHAGLATTDIACAAMTTVALLAAAWWIDEASWPRTAVFGAAVGLAVASRLSAIGFLGVAFAACYVLRGVVSRRWTIGASQSAARQLANAAMALAVACLVVWAAYRFDVGPLHPGGPAVPAPAFLNGVSTFVLHGSSGHPAFLLGVPRNHGWWYYFPVALLVKTPIPLLLLAVLGGAAGVKRAWATRDWQSAAPITSAIAMLALSMAVRVDLGIRLILPVYPLLAVTGAIAVAELWSHRARHTERVVVIALALWTVVIPVRAHPDHLAYFNELAGTHPEHVLVDSNLDWGQGLYRLRDTIAARGIRDSVFVAYFGTADVSAAGVPNARVLGLHEIRTGWIAASETYLAGEWVGHAYDWLLAYPPVARIGPSMLLWHITRLDGRAAAAAATVR